MTERTIEEALAHAEKSRIELPQIVQVSPFDRDVVILADEVLRLRAEAEKQRRLHDNCVAYANLRLEVSEAKVKLLRSERDLLIRCPTLLGAKKPTTI